MNSELTLRIIFATLYVLFMVTRAYFSRKALPLGEKTSHWERLKKVAEREGKLSVALQVILGVLWFTVVPLWSIYPQWMERFTLPFPIWLRWIGIGLGFASLPLLLWIHYALGRQWFLHLELRKQHMLITNGPYRLVRHPMYTATYAFMIALALLSANCLVALPNIVAIIVLYARIGKEEAMMIEQFGDKYRDYMKRTGRLLPRLTHEAD